MTQSVLMSLAFAGVNAETLRKNILAMQPNVLVAERILGGLKLPTLEQVQAKMSDRKVVGLELLNGFEESCLRVNYCSLRTVYSNVAPPTEKVMDYSDWRKWYNQDEVRTSGNKSDNYPNKVQYWDENWTTIVPENYL